PIGELAREPSFTSPERAELVDLLCRLGLRTFGDFAALNSTDVGSRFGADALRAQRQARGEPERLPLARTPPEELFVEYRPDPPLERVDAAAFAARRLAAGLHQRLTEAGGACTRLAIIAKTEVGEELSRIWRCAEPLTPAATADRIRWQLEGWLTHRAPDEGSPLVSLRLEPVEIVVAGELQLGLWGVEGKADERARRVLTRVQSLLGPAAVRVGVRSGGRGPGEQITTVAYGEELVPAADPDLPWPGRILGPAPTVVFSDPPEVGVEAAGGAKVWITDRGEFADRPAAVRWGGKRWPVTAWTRPWLLDERWWLPEGAQGVRVRAQFILGEQERAILLCGCDKHWYLEGMYE
ncbi:MAG: DNA polymerase Y family protein, partial [Mycobacterium sp.]|nr:DNA polymerase Y family protein [Mycobacterium sp.]